MSKSEKYEPDLVSVIIPTYNRADCITKAIDSVLAQTYKNYEIIIVDDGSTDDTKQVLQAYIERRDIDYMYKENAGCATARNAGIHKAHGEWIAFLDSDDRWHPEYLECQLKCLEYVHGKVSFANISFDFDGEMEFAEQNISGTLKADDFCLVNDALEIALVRNQLKCTLPGMVISRKLIQHLGGFDERVFWASDRRFILKLATEVPFGYLNWKLVVADRTPERKRITKDLSHKAQLARNSFDVLNYAEVYFYCRKQSKHNIKKARYMLGFYLSRLAVDCCVDEDYDNARRFARDGVHFGGNLRTYARCIAVLFFPRLVRCLRKNHYSDT